MYLPMGNVADFITLAIRREKKYRQITRRTKAIEIDYSITIPDEESTGLADEVGEVPCCFVNYPIVEK